MEKLIINGIDYVPADSIKAMKMAEPVDGMHYCIIRTYSAGIHAGYLKERNGKEVTLINARRLWKWAGAFTLSEIAVNGVTKPDECKFSTAVPKIILTEAIEIIPCTEEARTCLVEVKSYEC